MGLKSKAYSNRGQEWSESRLVFRYVDEKTRRYVYPMADSLPPFAGYHPWFSHRYTLTSPPPDKATHYSELFFTEGTLNDIRRRPESVPKKVEQYNLLMALLPYLPEPIPFNPLLQGMRENIRRCQQQERLVMVGESQGITWRVGC